FRCCCGCSHPARKTPTIAPIVTTILLATSAESARSAALRRPLPFARNILRNLHRRRSDCRNLRILNLQLAAAKLSFFLFPLPVRRERGRVRVIRLHHKKTLTPALSRRTGRGRKTCPRTHPHQDQFNLTFVSLPGRTLFQTPIAQSKSSKS